MLVYEMNEEDRQAAMRAFEQAHKAKPDLGFAPDRAWIEGWAFAQHPSQSAGEPEGVTCLRCGFVTYIQEGESPGHTTHRMQMERYRKAGLALEEPSPPPTDAARASGVTMERDPLSPN